MRTIIHPGMHKTGTTSIQMTLNEAAPDNVYFPETSGGHSGIAMLVFEQLVPPGLRNHAADSPRVMRERRLWMRTMQQHMRDEAYDTTVFSAERLASASRQALARMRNFFSRNSDDIRVVAYVRPPVGYMGSALQEMTKRGRVSLNLPYPKYRKAFEKFDQVFGRENVTLKKFDPKAFKNNDVQSDFFEEIGIDIPPERFKRANEGLSLEAFCLIYVQRHFGCGPSVNVPNAMNKNIMFSDALRKIGTEKLVLGPDLINPRLEANRDDLDWMEERLGQSLAEKPPADGVRMINSEDDILAVAEENRDAMEAILLDYIKADAAEKHHRLVRNLDLLSKAFD